MLTLAAIASSGDASRAMDSKGARSRAFPYVALFGLLSPMPLAAQGVTRVEETHVGEACSRCRVVIDTAVRITDPTGAGGLADPMTVAQGVNGRWLVAGRGTRGEISVYSPGGEFIRRVGREGEGRRILAGPPRLPTASHIGGWRFHPLVRQYLTGLSGGPPVSFHSAGRVRSRPYGLDRRAPSLSAGAVGCDVG